jgi:predicted O-methyltransferase YrrM
MKDWQSINGWLSINEGEELKRLSKGKIVLEIGSYCGRSTVAMSDAKVIFSIDPHDSSTTEPHPKINTLPIFLANVTELPIIPFLGRIEEIEKFLISETFDMVFIDGDHNYNACLRDIKIAERVVKKDGIIAIHDYGTGYPQLREVTNAIDSIWPRNSFRLVDSLVVKE